MTARTQEEILSRYRELADGREDFFGFRREVLASSMTGDTLRQTGLDLEESTLAAAPLTPPENLSGEASGYLEFAIGKIINHRGISASRSVDKLGEYAWLLGRDDVVEAMSAADYAQYGAPQVRAFAEGMGWPFLDATGDEVDRRALERMSAGDPCEPECEMGCGR